MPASHRPRAGRARLVGIRQSGTDEVLNGHANMKQVRVVVGSTGFITSLHRRGAGR